MILAQAPPRRTHTPYNPAQDAGLTGIHSTSRADGIHDAKLLQTRLDRSSAKTPCYPPIVSRNAVGSLIGMS